MLHESTSMSGNLYTDHWPSKNHKSDRVLPSIISSLNAERNFISVWVLSYEGGKEAVNIKSGKYGVKKLFLHFMSPRITVIIAK